MKIKVIVILSILIVFISGCVTNNLSQRKKKINLEAFLDQTKVKYFLKNIENIAPEIYNSDDRVEDSLLRAIEIVAMKYFTYEKIKPELLNELSKKFTEDELVEINRYLQSDANKKFSNIYPILLKDVEESFNTIFDKNKDVLNRRIQKRTLELKTNKDLAQTLLLSNQKKLKMKRMKNIYLSGLKNKLDTESLFENSYFKEFYLKGIEIALNIQIKKNSDELLYLDVKEDFISEYLSYDILKPHFISIFNEHFTKNELGDLNKFHKSSVSIKYTDYMQEVYYHIRKLFSEMFSEHRKEILLLSLKERIQIMKE